MKIIKTYNTVINESSDNHHLLTQEQIDWCKKHLVAYWEVNDKGEVHYNDAYIDILGDPYRFEVKFGTCTTFTCNSINLESLVGSPDKVLYDFIIDGSNIKTLEGAPEYVGDTLTLCNNNQLTSLDGSPNTIERLRISDCDQLTDLKGLNTVDKSIAVHSCKSFNSLDGLSKEFNGQIYSRNCGLPQEELIYNWENDINQDDVNTFKSDWEI